MPDKGRLERASRKSSAASRFDGSEVAIKYGLSSRHHLPDDGVICGGIRPRHRPAGLIVAYKTSIVTVLIIADHSGECFNVNGYTNWTVRVDGIIAKLRIAGRPGRNSRGEWIALALLGKSIFVKRCQFR